MYMAFAITQFPAVVASSSEGFTIMFLDTNSPHYIIPDCCLINLI